MAAGFGESYIRLWSLTGKGLKQLRTDLKGDEVGKIHDGAFQLFSFFTPSRMRRLTLESNTAADLKKLYHPSAPQTRKLIAHSGPVYSLSFDPVPGPASPPRYLLSCSSDTTIRLWSLETYTNLLVYRGHREPVWDVEWGPRGIYFASASRDRTARLWITDKIHAVRIFAGHLSDVNVRFLLSLLRWIDELIEIGAMQCVTFHPNSLYIATGSSDRTCRLWDVQKGMCVRVFVGHRGAVMKVKISPDGRWLASAGTFPHLAIIHEIRSIDSFSFDRRRQFDSSVEPLLRYPSEDFHRPHFLDPFPLLLRRIDRSPLRFSR